MRESLTTTRSVVGTASALPATAAAAASMHGMLEQVRREGAVHGACDLAAEPISLGGLLLLRQELELLAELGGVRTLILHIFGGVISAAARALIEQVWQSSFAIELRFEQHGRPDQMWPTAAIGRLGFSYQFFDRVSLLASALGRTPPRLGWSTELIRRAQALRSHFVGRLIVAHLKSVPNQGPNESNADQAAWGKFLARNARAGELDFVLLGADAVDSSVTTVPGVVRAEWLDVPLEIQLALIGCADAFLGMASGICAAAVLSATPYVLFKHPSHHVDEMRQELGDAEQFPFAGLHQKVWRRADTPDYLAQALAEISSAWTA